jgi:hypothetical protein
MTTNDIIQLLTQMTTDKQAMLDVLTDGQALLELGITDNDAESVECAYAIINQALNDRYAWLE